jgi:hypothetical protein
MAASAAGPKIQQLWGPADHQHAGRTGRRRSRRRPSLIVQHENDPEPGVEVLHDQCRLAATDEAATTDETRPAGGAVGAGVGHQGRCAVIGGSARGTASCAAPRAQPLITARSWCCEPRRRPDHRGHRGAPRVQGGRVPRDAAPVGAVGADAGHQGPGQLPMIGGSVRGTPSCAAPRAQLLITVWSGCCEPDAGGPALLLTTPAAEPPRAGRAGRGRLSSRPR